MSVPVPHRIERTANRHSRAVYRDDTIVIRLACGLSALQEQEHIDYLLGRMLRQVVRDRRRTLVDPFRPLLNGAQELTMTLTNGTSYLFRLQPGSKTRATRSTVGWDISVSPATRRRALHRFLWSLLSELAHDTVVSEVERINGQTFCERIGRIRLSYASTQWGSCSREKHIHLNPLLLFLPQDVLEYVIVHELAHCRIRNHSERYWQLVGSVFPLYKEARTVLRNVKICRL
jgi:hypothetical protein